MKPRPRSPSTPMPSVKLELGRYVTLRPRADGTYRVFFQVPAKLRPSDWPSLIPLPVNGARTGDLRNAAEVKQIQDDAKALYNRLQRARSGIVDPPGRTLLTLVRAWQASSSWPTSKKSQQHYEAYIRNVLALSAACNPPHPDPTHFTQSDIDTMLSVFNDRLPTKKHTLKAFRLIMAQARAMGWRTDNPCDGIKVKEPKSKVGIWEQADVDAYVAAAREADRESIALIILLEWEIGQRLTDVRAFRPGAEYDPKEGAFRFWQQKTESYVTIHVSDALRDLLAKAGEGELFLFRDERTGKAYYEVRLTRVFSEVREVAVAKGARPLKLRWLRHSCVVQLARAGCTHVEISAVTGHAVSSIGRILSVYLPRDNVVARNAQEKRGLVNRSGSGV